MKSIYVYSHEHQQTSAFYLEGRGGQWQGGVIHGSREAAFLTALISFFAWRGPESTIVFAHPEQRLIIEDLELMKNGNLKLENNPERRLFKRLEDTIREFKFLVTFRCENDKDEMTTERLKFYAKRMVDRKRESSNQNSR